jgi:hypothetical protein
MINCRCVAFSWTSVWIETMDRIMAGRTTLLILATALFVSAWSMDRDAATPQGGQTASVRETPLCRWQLPDPVASDVAAWEPSEPARREPSLPPGVYLVIDSSGRLERMVIDGPTLASDAANKGDDHFVVETGGVRRHWIRLELSQNEAELFAGDADKPLEFTSHSVSRRGPGGSLWDRLVLGIVQELEAIRFQAAQRITAESESASPR